MEPAKRPKRAWLGSEPISKFAKSETPSPMIPGMVDDVAQLVSSYLPFETLSPLRHLNKKWYTTVVKRIPSHLNKRYQVFLIKFRDAFHSQYRPNPRRNAFDQLATFNFFAHAQTMPQIIDIRQRLDRAVLTLLMQFTPPEHGYLATFEFDRSVPPTLKPKIVSLLKIWENACLLGDIEEASRFANQLAAKEWIDLALQIGTVINNLLFPGNPMGNRDAYYRELFFSYAKKMEGRFTEETFTHLFNIAKQIQMNPVLRDLSVHFKQLLLHYNPGLLGKFQDKCEVAIELAGPRVPEATIWELLQ